MVQHTVVLVSSSPWHGRARDVRPTLALLGALLASRPALVSVVSGAWASEEAQRQFGSDLLAKLPGRRLTHALVVDGDEFW
jgi:hypothetical protein